jgi:hypothetical protein
MPHLQYAQYGDMVMPTSVSASSELVGFPPTNISVLGKQFRSWRSVGLADEWIEMSFATPQPLIGLFMDQVLANNVNVGVKETVVATEIGVAYTSPVPIDQRVNRRKVLLMFTGAPPVVAVVKLSFNLFGGTAPLPGETVPGIELGGVVPITAWRDFPDHFQAPLRWRRMQSVTTVGLLGGGTQQQQEGHAYVQLALSNTYFKYIALPDFLARLNSPPGQPILIYENSIHSDVSQTYLMARLAVGADEFEERVTTFQSQIVFEEMI